MRSEIIRNEKPNTGKTAAARREKFIELAQKRTVNAIKAIRVIGKLGNCSAYEYTDADVSRTVKTLNDETEPLKLRLKSSGRQDAIDFKL